MLHAVAGGASSGRHTRTIRHYRPLAIQARASDGIIPTVPYPVLNGFQLGGRVTRRIVTTTKIVADFMKKGIVPCEAIDCTD